MRKASSPWKWGSSAGPWVEVAADALLSVAVVVVVVVVVAVVLWMFGPRHF